MSRICKHHNCPHSSSNLKPFFWARLFQPLPLVQVCCFHQEMYRALCSSAQNMRWGTTTLLRVPSRNYLRDFSLLLKIRASAREEAGEIVLSNSDFTDELKRHPGEPTQVPAGEGRGWYPSPRTQCSCWKLSLAS